MYGLEKCAKVSRKNNRKNENKLPVITTSPVRLSQFRSSDGRGGVGVGFSAFMNVVLITNGRPANALPPFGPRLSPRLVANRRNSRPGQAMSACSGQMDTKPVTS